MNQAQLATRQERAAAEPLVIQQVEHGFQVYAAGEPKHRYLVSGSPDAPQCTCPDFQYHRNDPNWHCKHILAVLNEFSDITVVAQTADPMAAAERRAIQEESTAPRRLRPTTAGKRNGKPERGATLALKRSVSPDGRIDSLSVEVSTPIEQLTLPDARTRAEEMLRLQADIVSQFLERCGHSKGNAASSAQPSPNGQPAAVQSPRTGTESPAVPARLVDVAGMDGKWGRRLFINVEVNGKTLRLFGKAEELAQHVRAAGYLPPEPFGEGAVLNIPCAVITKPSPDGRYTNVERVLPANQPQQTRPQPVRRIGQ
jgi:hypothetical protein